MQDTCACIGYMYICYKLVLVVHVHLLQAGTSGTCIEYMYICYKLVLVVHVCLLQAGTKEPTTEGSLLVLVPDKSVSAVQSTLLGTW